MNKQKQRRQPKSHRQLQPQKKANFCIEAQVTKHYKLHKGRLVEITDEEELYRLNAIQFRMYNGNR